MWNAYNMIKVQKINTSPTNFACLQHSQSAFRKQKPLQRHFNFCVIRMKSCTTMLPFSTSNMGVLIQLLKNYVKQVHDEISV